MSNGNIIHDSFFDEEKNSIHFDALMQDAYKVLREQSGDLWTDYAAHDPGVTLLEALAYNVSDLSYRTLLPLVDLLTPADATEDTTLFPDYYGAEYMLTTSPVTSEDYRKGILDLHTRTAAGENSHYFSDAACWKIEKDEEKYTWYYSKGLRQFSFEKNDESAISYHLEGSYYVLAKYDPCSAVNISSYNHATLSKILNAYLSENRNLCENFRRVVVADNPVNSEKLKMTIAVDKMVVNEEDIDNLFCDIYITAQSFFYAQAERSAFSSTVDFETYSGIRAGNGWLAGRLPETLYPSGIREHVIYASDIKARLEQIPNIVDVKYISFSADRLSLSLNVNNRLAEIFWYSQNMTKKSLEEMLKMVTLLRGTHKLESTADRLVTALKARQLRLSQQPEQRLMAGRPRDTLTYYSASNLLPEIYALQHSEPGEQPLQLHQFLLPFEQQLADGCAQISSLPQTMRFTAERNIPLWGHQWPFAKDSVGDKVHAAYKETLTEQDANAQDSLTQRIALNHHLLGYFGMSFTDVAGLTTAEEFYQAQSGLLRTLPETGYSRTAIHIGKVSSLQRRVAARLGVYGNLFDSAETNPIDLSLLPFYVIEHPQLLPVEPFKELMARQSVTAIAFAGEGAEETLTVTTDMDLTGKLLSGHLVDLTLLDADDPQSEGIQIQSLLIEEVSGKAFTIFPSGNAQLGFYHDQLEQAVAQNMLKWNCSSVWLNEMEYRYQEIATAYSDNINNDSPDIVRIVTSGDQPWPVILQPGNILTLKTGNAVGYGKNSISEELDATVLSVNAVEGWADVEFNTGQRPDADEKYIWYIRESDVINRDRFSFTLSFVFRRTLLSTDAGTSQEQAEIVKRIIQEEMPAHLQARVLWLSDNQFDNFCKVYSRWQEKQTRLSTDAFNLMKMLSIGMKPQLPTEGIGIWHISSQDEVDNLPKDQPERNEAIIDELLFYVSPLQK
ncbi:hypothetical protein [Enterobacter bugandensis]|uniref:hypothetical protein n=1 Tax=Enterobacter bugandensis TaxID=881260 RepID=UPI002FCF5930